MPGYLDLGQILRTNVSRINQASLQLSQELFLLSEYSVSPSVETGSTSPIVRISDQGDAVAL